MHITEKKRPKQCKEWKRISQELYNLQLDKNADYGRHAITGAGEIGVISNIWHKTCRLMELVGFDIDSGQYTGPKSPRVNEKIEETYRDLANYSIIAMIVRKGVWGK
jgi:hypothetical protein